jgi:Uma2 family endonuclease
MPSSSIFLVPIAAMPSEQGVSSADIFRALLKGKDYVNVGNQIIFEREGQFFLTMIEYGNPIYTNEHYQILPYKAPFQLINGKLVYMASPLYLHQDTIGNLYALMYPFIKKNKLGKVQFAPLDVHFDEENVFQPDLLFISNERKDIIKKWIHGAPDLIVEVLSSNKSYDLGEKREVYGKYNVLEYWAIDYKAKTLDAYVNEGKALVLKKSYKSEDEVYSEVLKGFSFVLGEIFD